ncbi:rCG57128, partial [Rattus norvegicus]
MLSEERKQRMRQ